MADLDENIVELQTLFIDQRAPILFVGEGNFTFSMAFAAMRGTWDGIISTTLETSLPHIEEVKDMTLLALTMNKYSGESINDADFIVRREKISSLSNDALRDWRAAIDATRDLSQFKSQRNIWFQCPWDWSPVKLLKDFVSHCSTFQQPGDLLLIGIVYKDYSKFYEKYDLKNFLNLKPKELDSLFEYSRNTRDTSLILNGNNSFINQKDYELLYPDKCLVKEILVHGYFHKSVNGNDNLHRQFHRDNIHRTIVLRKKLGVEDIISPLTELKFDQVTDNCQNNLANKNVKFVEEVDETMISTQNFIVAQNLTVVTIKNKMKCNF
uniref:25S rRNA (uridine-N(3))-methyltransferase BMT5-like domain-containing protein n=1 Tax=Panagrolaimus sp. ES5 TaxID=591445 RepID=A0AC34FA51_9BILA